MGIKPHVDKYRKRQVDFCIALYKAFKELRRIDKDHTELLAMLQVVGDYSSIIQTERQKYKQPYPYAYQNYVKDIDELSEWLQNIKDNNIKKGSEKIICATSQIFGKQDESWIAAYSSQYTVFDTEVSKKSSIDRLRQDIKYRLAYLCNGKYFLSALEKELAALQESYQQYLRKFYFYKVKQGLYFLEKKNRSLFSLNQYSKLEKTLSVDILNDRKERKAYINRVDDINKKIEIYQQKQKKAVDKLVALLSDYQIYKKAQECAYQYLHRLDDRATVNVQNRWPTELIEASAHYWLNHLVYSLNTNGLIFKMLLSSKRLALEASKATYKVPGMVVEKSFERMPLFLLLSALGLASHTLTQLGEQHDTATNECSSDDQNLRVSFPSDCNGAAYGALSGLIFGSAHELLRYASEGHPHTGDYGRNLPPIFDPSLHAEKDLLTATIGQQVLHLPAEEDILPYAQEYGVTRFHPERDTYYWQHYKNHTLAFIRTAVTAMRETLLRVRTIPEGFFYTNRKAKALLTRLREYR